MSNKRCAMLSRPLEALLVACWLSVWLVAPPPAAGSPTRDEVDAAALALRDIATLTGSRTEHELRLKQRDRETERPDPGAVQWLTDFIGWLNDAGRWLVWAAGAVALAVVALRLRAWLARADAAAGPERLPAPTHVRDLDIRPQTLPADIGAAAWALWQAGDVTAAMSLLYRGALSRLVHGHAVPIRASSTEGDCLRLAATRVAPATGSYLEELVDCWRRTVYAARPPADERGRALCGGFAAHFPPAAAAVAGAAA
jgi:Domain of unknown function (DUF4129)